MIYINPALIYNMSNSSPRLMPGMLGLHEQVDITYWKL